MSLISIIIPVYNSAKYLSECLDSILAQTFKDFKVLIINDCSTDESEDIIMKYAKIFGEKMTYVKNQQNIKQSQSRNIGLQMVEENESKYIAFIDSDDWVSPNYLNDMYKMAEEQEADIVVCGIERFEDGTNKVMCREAVNGNKVRLSAKENMQELAYINPAPYNKLFNFSAIKDYRYKTMKRSEDTCYFFELLQAVDSIAFTNSILYHYRIRKDSLTGAIGVDDCYSMMNGFEKTIIPLRDRNVVFIEEFETQIFIRVACGGVCRAAFSDFSLAPHLIRKTKDYLNTVTPNWRKNRYLSFGYKSESYKASLLKVLALLYKLNAFILFVYAYYFFLKILKKDIRA